MTKQQFKMKADTIERKRTKPLLKTKGFSTLHLDIFEHILLSYQTNRALNHQYGYSKGSHQVVDHSRKVMYKLLALENLKKAGYRDQVIYPRQHRFWWKRLLDKHKQTLVASAVTAEFYDLRCQKN